MDKIRQLITCNKIEEAFTEIKLDTNSKAYEKEILLLERRYHQIQRSFTSGFLTAEQKETNINVLVSNLLDLVQKQDYDIVNPKDTSLRLYSVLDGKDEFFFKELEKYLLSFRNKYPLEIWDESKLSPGEVRSKAIEYRIEHSDVFLFLITANFIASNHCQKIMDRVIRRYEAERKVYLIPVYTDYAFIPDKLMEFKIMPHAEIPISSSNSWASTGQPYLIVAQRVEEAIMEIINHEKPEDDA